MAGFALVVVTAEFEAWDFVNGEAVVAAFLDLEVEDGEAAGGEEVGLVGLEPGEDLAFGNGAVGEKRDQICHPGAGGDDQAGRLVAGAVGGDGDAFGSAGGFPAADLFAGVDDGAFGLGERDVGDDGAFAGDQAAVRLEDGAVGVGEMVAGVAGVDLGAGEDFVLEAVKAG